MSRELRKSSGGPVMKPRHVINAVRALLLVLLAIAMLTTPGFFSTPSIIATLDYTSLIGLVALGMAFVTISGNIMSLALSATMATCGEVFLLTSNLGMWTAIAIALVAGVVVTGIQGFILGPLRGNPIL